MSKYGNRREGRHASRKEAARSRELESLARCGAIAELREQVPYVLIPKLGKERETKYLADFVYVEDGRTVVEDCKGYRTEVYRIKRKLMQQVHGIVIRET